GGGPAGAGAAVGAALSRLPRARPFRTLWPAHQSPQPRRRQELAPRESERLRHDDGPVLLPFVAPADRRPAGDVPTDGPATLPGPHSPRLADLPDRRSAR